MRSLVVLLAAAAARGADVPAIVWSGAREGKTYDFRQLAARDVGAKLTATESAVTLLVVLPQASAVGLADQLSGKGRRLTEGCGVEVLPFVAAPGAASAYFESGVEVVEWPNVIARLETATEKDTLLTVAPDVSVVDADLTAAVRSRAAFLGDADSWVLGLAAANAVEPRRRLQDDDDDAGPIGVRMTPDILTGILVMMLFTFTILVGLGCISAIQTPSLYAKTGPPSLKEW